MNLVDIKIKTIQNKLIPQHEQKKGTMINNQMKMERDNFPYFI